MSELIGGLIAVLLIVSWFWVIGALIPDASTDAQLIFGGLVGIMLVMPRCKRSRDD